MPARKGLLAPQNNFLDTIAKRFDGTHSNFVLGNAQASGHPIVYCSDGFCELTGFPRAKVMSRDCSCQFLCGTQTSQEDIKRIAEVLTEQREDKIEILFYRSNGSSFWCLLDIVPIKNEKGAVVLFLVSHKDITQEKLVDTATSGATSSRSAPAAVAAATAAVSGIVASAEKPLQGGRRCVADGAGHDQSCTDDGCSGGSSGCGGGGVGGGAGTARDGCADCSGATVKKQHRSRSKAVLYHLSAPLGHKKLHFSSKIETMPGGGGKEDEKLQYTAQASAGNARCVILHYGLFKIIWDWLILICTFYIAIIVPYNAAFLTPYNTEEEHRLEKNTIYTDVIVELLFMADMIMNFRTTFVSKTGQVVSEPRLMAVHYVKSWFFLDILAAIPFDLLYVFQVKTLRDEPSAWDNMNTVIPLLKIARLLRLARLLQKIDRYSQYSAVVLTLLMSMYALISHWMACIWFVIGYTDLHRRDEWRTGWLYSLAENLYLPINRTVDANGTSIINGAPLMSSYVSALYFTTTVLTSVGFGNIAANSDSEKIFSVIAMMIGALMHAAVFGNVTAIIQRLYARKATYHSKTRDLKDFFRTHHIPKPLKTRMQEFFQTTWSLNNGIDQHEVMRDFPEELKSDIALHLHRELLAHGIFEGLSQGCLKMLALAVKTTFSAPGETLLTKGDAVQYLYYICSGSMEILKDGLVVAILGKGDLFGCDVIEDELCELSVVKSGVNVRALTYCVLQCLSVKGLIDVISHYPEMADRFVVDLKQELTYNIREFHDAEDETSIPLPSISEDEEDDTFVQLTARSEDSGGAGCGAAAASQLNEHKPVTGSASAPQISSYERARFSVGDSVFSDDRNVSGGRRDSTATQRKAGGELPKRSLSRAGSRKLAQHGSFKVRKPNAALQECVSEIRQEMFALKLSVASVNERMDGLQAQIAKMTGWLQAAVTAASASTAAPAPPTVHLRSPQQAAAAGKVDIVGDGGCSLSIPRCELRNSRESDPGCCDRTLSASPAYDTETESLTPGDSSYHLSSHALDNDFKQAKDSSYLCMNGAPAGRHGIGGGGGCDKHVIVELSDLHEDCCNERSSLIS